MSEARSCVIAGGGPAGMIAGLLLARAGVDVVVLEKHQDFLRDFRGDTIHPSTLQLLDELGLMPRFQASVPHQRVQAARLPASDGGRVTMVDFSRLCHPYPYIAMAPQWEFLDLLAEAAADEPSFELRLGTEVTGLLWDGSEPDGSQHDDDSASSASSAAQVTGVTVRGPAGDEQIPALLTLAADGRASRVRELAGLRAVSFPVSLDVWWFRLESSGTLDRSLGMAGTILPSLTSAHPILPIPRGGYVQAAMLIPKGADARLRARGVEALREEVASAVPDCAEAARRLQLDDVKLLDVRMDRLTRWWRRGMLCLGDAAHAMSPAGGVGVNLAVQDGVAAATLLAEPLRRGVITDADVAAVQRRRMPPTRLTQALQSQVHRQLEATFAADAPPEVPAPVARLVRRVPRLSGLMPWVIGVGVRPEHAPAWARR
ncbi:FAD-dependent oxidoreductase [Nesterenkonia suensis]